MSTRSNPITVFFVMSVVLLSWSGMVAAQKPDGTILLRELVTLPEDSPDPKRAEAYRAVLENARDVRLERIVYISDDLEVEGFIASPEGEPENPLPCVIFLRGGNRGFGELNPIRAAGLFGRIAQRGYVVMASNYRGKGDFGREKYPGDRICSDCEGHIGGKGREEFGGAEVNDVLALIPLLDNLPEADSERMAIYGWSRGGMMTYLTLKESDHFKAAIVGAGVADAAAGVEQRPDMAEHVYAELVPGWEDPETRSQALEARSAVRWADQLPATTPILILHGTSDWRVDPTQALDMARALLEARRPYRLVMFEGGDHGLREYRDEVDRLTGEWLDLYVRDGATWPSLEPHGK